MERAQGVGEKNNVICLVMFTSKAMVTKCQKWLSFYIFC